MFKSISAHFIETVCRALRDKYGTEPLGELMELLLSLEDEEQLRNILCLAKDLGKNNPTGCL